MFKNSIIWTNFADGKTIYEMFKDYGIGKNVECFEKITYVRFTPLGSCQFRWTPRDNTTQEEKEVYEYWVSEGYTELKMFEEDKEYVGTI